MPRRRRELRPSTARRYQWYVEHYITPAVGVHRLAGLRAEHLDRMYNDLLAHGGRDGEALSAKTVYDVHVVMRSSLRFVVDHLVDHNVATDARPPRISTRSRPSPEIWTAQQLASFLTQTAHLRLYPAIHLAATTGMRRVRSPVCDGAIGTSTPTDSQLRVADRASRAAPSKSRPRPQQADARSTSMPTPSKSSPDGAADNNVTGTRSEFTIRCSRTGMANRSIPNRSASCSTARHSAAGCRGSGYTTYVTLTRHFSSLPANPSRSCPNASAMPTPGSRWPPTNTSCLAWAQLQRPTSLRCSPPPAVNTKRRRRRSAAW